MKRFRNLALLVLVLATFLATESRTRAYQEDYCTCYRENFQNAWVYIYELTWNFVDQSYFQQAYYLPGGSGGECENLCVANAFAVADSLCNNYGDANHHIQIQLLWHFEDSDNSGGGTASGGFDSGSTNIIMCSSI